MNVLRNGVKTSTNDVSPCANEGIVILYTIPVCDVCTQRNAVQIICLFKLRVDHAVGTVEILSVIMPFLEGNHRPTPTISQPSR